MLQIFTDAPEILQDGRQGGFKAVAAAIAEEEQADDFRVANVFRGFYAASVNVGWLQDKIEAYYEANRPTVKTVKMLIKREAPEVVQRLKGITVTPRRVDLREHGWGEATDLHIRIHTKDDHGYYTYTFTPRLFDEGRPG